LVKREKKDEEEERSVIGQEKIMFDFLNFETN
jgi:hypothetical protein